MNNIPMKHPLWRRVSWTGGAILLALAVLATVLPGCRDARGQEGPVEIVYWTGWSGNELEIQQALVDEFNRKHPEIRVRMLSVFGSYQKVRIAFAGGDTPDLCSAVWSDELAGYAMRGALTPLDDFMEASGRTADEWMPGAWDMLQYHGHTWGLMSTINSHFIVYNKDAFEREGLSVPKDLDGFDRVNEALMVQDERGSYKSYGMRPSGLLMWAYVFGGHWFEHETGTVTANHPKNVEALRYLQKFAETHDIRRMEVFESTFGSMETPSGPFFTGKQKMLYTGSWIGESIRRYAPEGFRYGYFATPPPEGGRPNCSTLGGSVFVIPAASKNKQEAWTFLNWFVSPDVNRRWCDAILNASPLKAAAESPKMQSDPLLRFSAMIQGGPNAFGPPQMPIWPAYVTAITRAEDQAVHAGKDPKELLDGVQRQIEREWARAKREAVY